MQLTINNSVINASLTDSNTVGDAFFKFLIKFPSVVRKPEFCFISDLPEEMASIASKHHFNQGKGTNIEDEDKHFLTQNQSILGRCTYSEICFIHSEKIPVNHVVSYKGNRAIN